MSVAELHPPTQWCIYLSLATDILWAATGRRWRGAGHVATASLRPAPPRPGEARYHPVRSAGSCDCWWSAPAGIPIQHRSAHYEPDSIRLPHPDVTAVTQILDNGSPFAGSWRLDGAWLTRTDGYGWPACGDRVQVTYTFGIDPPPGGKASVVELASQLGIAAAPDCDMECRLPSRVRSISRQGISLEITDPLEFVDKGRVGIPSIDMWVVSVNPKGRSQRARVWHPDQARARRTS